MKKKVLFVIDTLRMGGAEKSLVTLLKGLDPQRLDIVIFLFEKGGSLEKEVPNFVRIQYADAVTRAMTLEFRIYFKDLIKSFHWIAAFSRLKFMLSARYEKKHKFYWKSISRFIPQHNEHFDIAIGYLEGFPNYYVIDKVIADKKIGWIHSDFSKQIILPEAKEYYAQFDSLVTISDVCCEALRALIPSQKIIVLPNVVLKEDILKKSEKQVNWDKHKYHIITVGRIEHVKGIDLAFEAAKLVHQSYPCIQWHVFGKGSLIDSINQMVEKEIADDFFLLEGETKNPYPYMREADILVQPSRWEGKSIVLDEAKLLGKAIVVTNYPSVSDQIVNYETGLIAEINPDSIAQKVIQLILKPDLKRTLEQNCARELNDSVQTIDKFYQLVDG